MPSCVGANGPGLLKKPGKGEEERVAWKAEELLALLPQADRPLVTYVPRQDEGTGSPPD